MLLMCDQNAVTSRGDGSPDGEETVSPPSSAAAEGGEMMPSGHWERLAPTHCLVEEERGALREEVGQEDVEMSSSHDLCPSAHQSPESAMGSSSSFTKRY